MTECGFCDAIYEEMHLAITPAHMNGCDTAEVAAIILGFLEFQWAVWRAVYV